MCYYNQYTGKLKLLFSKQQVDIEAYNLIKSGFEYPAWPIIKNHQNKFSVINAHWEFIAPWLKNATEIIESRKKYSTLNATCEKLFESKLFANAKPCLVLSTGFYEWRHIAKIGTKKTIAYPYFIKPKYETYFLMAGIYNEWLDRESGELIPNFAIVTTVANPLMAQIHNLKKRMPTILPLHLAEQWLIETDIEKRKQLASFQLDLSQLTAYTVAKDFKTKEVPNEEFYYEELTPIG